MAKTKPKSTWQKVRKTFNDLHLWMGIASAIILFLVCLSGTIYTFSSEIQEIAEPHKYTVSVAPGAQRMPAEALIASVMKHAGGGTVVAVTIPEDKARTYQVSVRKEEKKDRKDGGQRQEGKKEKVGETKGGAEGKGGGGARPTTYLVNPYTAEVLGTPESSTSQFFMVMFRLHRWLLLDMEVGRPIVGVATVIFALLIISGWVIWFPKKVNNWRQGLKVNTKGNWKRINHDLHNSLGMYASIFLLIMALTGLTWSFQWYKNGLNKILGVHKPEGAHKEDVPQSTIPGTDATNQRLSIADYLKAADGILTYPGDYRVTLPSDSVATVAISKNKLGFFAPAASDRVLLDQYSAQPLKTEFFDQKPLNEKLASSYKSLHIGNYYGTFSKILYFITCLIATSLPVTGTLIWINKLRKKPAAKKPRIAVQMQTLS